ncbi:arabinosyltransferase domain-containing protein [Geodermatophilus sp. CPCC 205506]|uniref:arabinosyltransferase domain-containing protein n=1 Tax=Geodermatophilus sp. CPCC 205506 TaxID=2936596 RepID=UPI003EEA3FD1
MDVVDRVPAGPDVTDRPSVSRGGRVRRVLPLLLALVAIACSVALPLAPVEMSVPTVSWPQDPARPASTMLELTNQQPLAVDVSFSCAAVRAAAATPDGVLVSTLEPGHPAARTDGLLVTARDGRLAVLDRGQELLDEPVAAGDCAYRVTGDAGGLVLERDGREVAAAAGGADALPDVDVLATSLTALPSDGDLRVELTVDNQFNTTPTRLKQVLVALALLAAAGSLVALWRADRRRAPVRPDTSRSGGGKPAPAARVLSAAVDVVVVATAVLWLFLAPLSDDDGYYAAMARNAEQEGFVGNYYQLLNQSFTPFTWFYRFLGWWQELGDSPALLRVPALVCGLATWVLLRRLTTRPGALPAAVAGARWGGAVTVVVLATVFLAWWLPYGMGVRPEAVVGVLALAVLAGILAGLRRRRLLPVALAVGAAGLAVAGHPTGFVALAPLVAALPRLARLVREDAAGSGVAARVALLLAPGAFAAVAAFADGSLYDFRRGQEIFLSIQEQNSWYDEWQRYGFLLNEIPMGSYARRAAVLAGIAALLWFLVLSVAARASGLRIPATLLLAGQSLAAALLLLWLTPSKWTHHFGALSGLGPLFLALFLVSAPVLVRRLLRETAASPVTPVLAVGSAVVVAALALHGPNSWPYTWLPGMPHPGEPPFVGPVVLGSLATWTAVAVVVLLAVRLVGRRRRTGWGWPVAVPVLVLVFLAVSVGHLLGSFAVATLRTLDGLPWSPWADSLTDPSAEGCGAAGGIDVLDVSAARPLEPDAAAPEAPGPGDFVPGGGWFAPGPPPAAPGTGVARYAWGSLPDGGGEDATGEQVTPWFAVPATGDDEALAVLAAGRLTVGNELRVEYARADGEVVATQELTDRQDAPRWRTFVLDAGPAGDAALLRLVAEDRSGGTGGWLAFTGPSVLPRVPLSAYLPEDAAVAVAWQFAFAFPCQRQPVVRYGITEPAEYGVLWRFGADGDGLADNTWAVARGGLFAPVQRTSSVTELDTVIRGHPEIRDVQVYRFGVPHPERGYDLSPTRVVVPGWTGAPAP